MILTGSIGSGKSTLLTKLFPEKLPGLTSWAVPKQGVYLRDNLSEKSVQVGVFDHTLPGTKNKMRPLPEGFTEFGISALKRCMENNSPWITVDEIGYLEACCPDYYAALCEVFAAKQVAAVVRKQNLPFLQEICGRNDVFVVDPDDPFGNIGCVIMASGLGRRFGGNKLMADFHGSPLICRILDATDGIFAKRVVVTRDNEIKQLCEERDIQTVLHDLPHRSDTVRLGIESMSEMDRCIFVAADQPLLRNETVASLALASKNAPLDIWRPCFDQTAGAPVIFPRWSFEELTALPEGKGGSVLIKKYPERVRTVGVRDKYELSDVDTPEDLRDLLLQYDARENKL